MAASGFKVVSSEWARASREQTWDFILPVPLPDYFTGLKPAIPAISDPSAETGARRINHGSRGRIDFGATGGSTDLGSGGDSASGGATSGGGAAGGASDSATSVASTSAGSTATGGTGVVGGTTVNPAGGAGGSSRAPQASGTNASKGNSGGGCAVAGIERSATRWGATLAFGAVVAEKLRRLVNGSDQS